MLAVRWQRSRLHDRCRCLAFWTPIEHARCQTQAVLHSKCRHHAPPRRRSHFSHWPGRHDHNASATQIPIEIAAQPEPNRTRVPSLVAFRRRPPCVWRPPTGRHPKPFTGSAIATLLGLYTLCFSCNIFAWQPRLNGSPRQHRQRSQVERTRACHMRVQLDLHRLLSRRPSSRPQSLQRVRTAAADPLQKTRPNIRKLRLAANHWHPGVRREICNRLARAAGQRSVQTGTGGSRQHQRRASIFDGEADKESAFTNKKAALADGSLVRAWRWGARASHSLLRENEL